MNRKLVFCLLLFAALLIAGCSGQAAAPSATPTPESITNDTPANGAKAYYYAALLGEGNSESLICSTMPANSKQVLQAAMDTARAMYTQSKAGLDLSELTFTAQNESGDTADVVIAGKLIVTFNGKTSESDYSPHTMKMKNENGWKVCG